jgi:adenylate cyclase
MSGVEIHAHVIDMLLSGRFLARAGGASTLALFGLIGVAASLVVGRSRPWVAAAALGGVVLGSLALGYVCFATFELWMPIAGPVLSAIATWGTLAFQSFASERKEKEFVRGALERYVSPEVVRDVIERRIDLALSGRRQTITVLFSDLRGFTGLSERLPPETVVEILNEHFTAASETILRHGGTLDKFIGDAVMAFWNAPVPRADHALCAVRAALEMQAAAAALDARVKDRLGERLRIGVGINTGDAIVGHIGSARRLGYTAIGDPVNIAARVEALTREQDAVILVTQFTYELVKFDVEAEPLGVVPIRGRRDAVALYRVTGLKVARAL